MNVAVGLMLEKAGVAKCLTQRQLMSWEPENSELLINIWATSFTCTIRNNRFYGAHLGANWLAAGLGFGVVLQYDAEKEEFVLSSLRSKLVERLPYLIVKVGPTQR